MSAVVEWFNSLPAGVGGLIGIGVGVAIIIPVNRWLIRKGLL